MLSISNREVLFNVLTSGSNLITWEKVGLKYEYIIILIQHTFEGLKMLKLNGKFKV